MSSNEHSTFKIAFNLAAACFISGIVIGSVYFVTAPVAAQKAEEMKQESMKSLVPEAEHFTEVAGHEGWFAAEKAARLLLISCPLKARAMAAKSKCSWP